MDSVINKDTVYLLIKSVSETIVQILRQRKSIEKLEFFLKKRHYDVAYRFAKNEKFSNEVLMDILKYHGDFYYEKVRGKLYYSACIKKLWKSIKKL